MNLKLYSMKQIFINQKIIILFIILFGFQSCVSSKRFSNTIIVTSTELKNQKMTGQCWAFASASLLEAEAIRLGYDLPKLSSFFYVYHNYLDQANQYIKTEGKSYIKPGNLTFSVLEILRNYGAMPENIYNGGLNYVISKKQMLNRWAEEDEMNSLIKVKLDSLLKTKTSIEKSMLVIEYVLNHYIGTPPNEFVYNQHIYTSESFAKKLVPLKSEDYVEITSYTHHPFYSNIILEIPANWRNKSYLNLPINDFISVIDNAIHNGFTLAWDGDIGNKGGFRENGYVYVRGEYEDEPMITQAQRQSAYERKTTTDDHNMHLVGITYTRDGQKFYILKNTWGENRGINGMWYLSENYFKLRTISVTVHKDAIPKDIFSKIGK
jgi:bleomycin hydrolase